MSYLHACMSSQEEGLHLTPMEMSDEWKPDGNRAAKRAEDKKKKRAKTPGSEEDRGGRSILALPAPDFSLCVL